MKELPIIEKGDVIRAAYLNDITGYVNKLVRDFTAAPAVVGNGSPAEVQNQLAQDANDNQDSEAVDLNLYVESARAVDSVLVYDQNDTNYAEVSRMSEVQLVNAAGEVLTFRFNNGA